MKRAIALGILLAAGGAIQARAELLVYAGFDSGAEGVPLTGLSPGTTAIGFAGTWVTSADGLVYETPASGLQFPVNVQFPLAGGFVVRQPAYSPVSAQIPLAQAIDFSAEGKTYYLSFLYRDRAANPDNEMTMTLDTETDRFSVGWLYRDTIGFGVIPAGTMAYQDARQFQFKGPANLTGDIPYFVVVKLVTHEYDLDEVYLKIYDATTERADVEETFDWTTADFVDLSGPATHLGFTSEGVSRSSMDEIRIGTLWSDVVKAGEVAPISITQQPANRTVALGANVTFSVQATGEGTLTYQWRRNGTPLTGQTEAILSLENVSEADAGAYTVEVKDGLGGAKVSDPAVLTVATSPTSAIALHAGIRFEGVVGLHYRVDYREAIDPVDEWKPLQEIAALPVSPYTAYDPTAATEPKRFYRVVIVP